MAPRAAYYLSTPIYYVNDSPHIGHAYTSLACDVLARFMRLEGRDVMFLTGTDEHGQKVQKSAIAAGMEPQDFVDQVSERFRALGGVMGYSNDDFIRTTEDRTCALVPGAVAPHRGQRPHLPRQVRGVVLGAGRGVLHRSGGQGRP